MKERADRKRKSWQQKDNKRYDGLDSDDLDMMALQGLTKCRECQEVIPLWIDNCPECGATCEHPTTNA
jgi:ribosomal protein L32